MKKLKNNGITIVDFFCGAGIGAIGAEYAGFESIFAFDNNPHAVKTYNRNLNPVAECLDIKKDEFKIPWANIFTGGFPCQPFSFFGKGLGKNDLLKGDLGEIFSYHILDIEPDAFLIENVKGIIQKKNISYFEELINILSLKYNVSWKLINCTDYGVPQKRERVFVVGFHKKYNKVFNFINQNDKITNVKEALQGLSRVPDNKNNHYNNDKFKVRNDERPFVHKVPIGGNWKDLPVEDQKAFMKKGYYSGGGRTGALWKVDPDKPSKTILSTPMGKATAQILDWEMYDGSIGYSDPRRFTVRESLRLQTVPDSFSFGEDISINKQYERCSGIPSIVEYKLLLEMKKQLFDLL